MWTKDGLSPEQIDQLITKYRDAGFRVTDNMGSHGISHVYNDSESAPIAYITPNTVGLVPSLSKQTSRSTKKIIDIADNI